jgi:hypothetical protein
VVSQRVQDAGVPPVGFRSWRRSRPGGRAPRRPPACQVSKSVGSLPDGLRGPVGIEQELVVCAVTEVEVFAHECQAQVAGQSVVSCSWLAV